MRQVRICDLSTLAPNHLDRAHRIGRGWETRELTASEKQMLINLMINQVTPINHVAGTRSDYGYMTVVYTDDIAPLPNDEISYKNRVVNGNFKKIITTQTHWSVIFYFIFSTQRFKYYMIFSH